MDGPNILVVDDEEIILVSAQRELENAGYTVTTARSGQQAISFIKQRSFDIVYIDMIMPGMDMADVCRLIKKLSPTTEIIAISGYPIDEESLKKKLYAAGGVKRFLRKPLIDDELSSVTYMVLQERRFKEEDKMINKRILVVDDVELVCTAFQRELSQAGFEVDSALSGEEAVKKAKEKKYDLVFIDMIMPGMDGVQTCSALKEISPDSVLVFMTGKIDENTIYREVEFSKSGGESYYLYKPFAEGEILNVAKKALQ